MGGRVDAEVRVFPDFGLANRAVADRIHDLASESLERQGQFSLVLAGGSTPRGLYTLLADEFGEMLDWSMIDLFWGDERYVPHDDPQSNFRMAREALLDRISIPSANVYPMPTNREIPEDAARAYDGILRSYFEGHEPRFDLVLLGIGADGHTASLFPGSSALAESDRWVVSVQGPTEPSIRLTLTYPIVNRARNVFVLARGAEKADAVRQALATPPDPAQCPASGIDPKGGRLVWWLDESAAAS